MPGFFREPLTHFLVLGGLLILIQQYGWADRAEYWFFPESIEITEADEARLRQQWVAQVGRQPSEIELSAAIQSFIDEELLFREAKRLGLHKRDAVVRQRLLLNMRFAEQDQKADQEALVASAFALGMVDSDLVVRRRLVQLMRHRLESEVQISEAELQSYYLNNPDQFRLPGQLDFEHLYFSPDKRGLQTIPDAEDALVILTTTDSTVTSDPFLLGSDFPALSATKADDLFGTDFVASLKQAPIGEWYGPVQSNYGLHLVRVRSRVAASVADFDRVRSKASANLFASREKMAVRSALENMRSRYRISIMGSTS